MPPRIGLTESSAVASRPNPRIRHSNQLSNQLLCYTKEARARCQPRHTLLRCNRFPLWTDTNTTAYSKVNLTTCSLGHVHSAARRAALWLYSLKHAEVGAAHYARRGRLASRSSPPPPAPPPSSSSSESPS